MPKWAHGLWQNEVRRPTRVVFKPPVSVEDLKTDTECDPEGAEEFVALTWALRRQSSPPPNH